MTTNARSEGSVSSPRALWSPPRIAQGGTEVVPTVKRKFLIGLASLVIVAAFAAVPAAQGAPHVYKMA